VSASVGDMNKIFVKSAMSKNNRTYMNLFLFIAIFCLVYFCFACDKKGDKAENQKRTEKFASKWLENLAKPDQEIVALLAIKYNKKLDVIEKILDIYLTDTDYGYRQIKSTIKRKDKEETKKPNEINLELFALDKSAYADTVAKISNQFSLEPAIVASILVDYKTWKAAESRTSSE
jgi:hypothetical protein